jgi:hypothetical protein
MQQSDDICGCGACSEAFRHASDCAVHNEPARPRGECDCATPAQLARPRGASATEEAQQSTEQPDWLIEYLQQRQQGLDQYQRKINSIMGRNDRATAVCVSAQSGISTAATAAHRQPIDMT